MKTKIIPYRNDLKDKARALRKNSTLSEVLLWQHLKGKQRKGYDFHRQKPITKYIVDFYCPKLLLAIEIDGESHRDDRLDADKTRQNELELLGVHFLRFLDEDVKFNMEGVILKIDDWIDNNAHNIPFL
jgi:very-short-patch-repair endonuclease